VFFSSRCPLFRWELSLAQRLWYTYGTWSYFCTIFTLPTFIVVPFLSLLFGLHPVVVDRWFAISGTIYYVSIYMVQNYCRWARRLQGCQGPCAAGLAAGDASGCTVKRACITGECLNTY
jgi:hypothetical protein